MEMNYQKPDNRKALEKFGKNLTTLAAANKLSPVIGRDDEIRRIIRILSRKTKNNPILIGDPGVGKTAIIEGLAKKIVLGDVPSNLKNKKLIELDTAAIIAGSSYQGEFEKRLKEIIVEIEKSAGEIIVFIDEVHTLIGMGKVGNNGGMDAAQIIKPMLARGQLRLIGATTFDEHKKYIESDPAFERRLQQVMINEPSEIDAITILRGLKESYENYHGVKISDSAIVQSVKLSMRYITERFLPDKAIDLIDEASSGIKTQINSKPEKLEKLEHKLALAQMEKVAISKEEDVGSQARLLEVKKSISKLKDQVDKFNHVWNQEKTNIKILSELKIELEDLKYKLHQHQSDGQFEKASKILYQDIPRLERKIKKHQFNNLQTNALIKETVEVQDIADVVSKWTGIAISKLLKTEKEKILNLDKILKLRIKGQDHALEVITNTILRSKADINDPNRPLGSFVFMGPTGVGKTEVAKALAEQLFDSDKALVRIDMSEYMEAHAVSRLIGSPPGYIGFEEGGQLTERIRKRPYAIILFDEIEKAHPRVLDLLLQILDDGRITDAKGKHVSFKNTIIILTTNIGSQQILNGKSIPEKIHKELFTYLKPEFINRLDEIVIFNALDKEVIKVIAINELDKLIERLQTKDISIKIHPEVVDHIVANAYEPIFGARPIKRYIQKNLEPIISRAMISEKIKPKTKYEIRVEDKKLVIIDPIKTFN